MEKMKLKNLKTLKLSSFVTKTSLDAAKVKGGCTWKCYQTLTPDACP